MCASSLTFSNQDPTINLNEASPRLNIVFSISSYPPAEVLVSFYRSPPENQSLEQHQADEELDIKVTDREQYNYARL